jgi:hypothetical protein
MRPPTNGLTRECSFRYAGCNRRRNMYLVNGKKLDRIDEYLV